MRLVRQSISALAFCIIAASAIVPASALAREWFVRAGNEGDGSKANPFKDPYLALEKAEAGDTIHVAGGTYHGKLDVPNYSIALPKLKLLGGYDATFAARDPWKNPSLLSFIKDSKVVSNGTLLRGDFDHTGCVIDGFVLDQKEKNAYVDKAYGDLDTGRSAREPIATFTSPGVEIRNCLILNGSSGGVILAGEGCRFENNIVMNVFGHLLELRGNNQAKATLIKNNTFLFSWSPVYGKGGPDGLGVKLVSGTKADVINNIFVNCDNHAVFIDTKPDRVTLKGNVFWLNGYSNVKFFIEGRDVVVDNANMGEIEDVGLKAVENNTAADPQLGGFDPQWMERFINRTAAEQGKVKMDDWNKFRQLVGAPLEGEGGKGPSGFAMAYDWKKAQTLIPKAGAAGARPVPLTVTINDAGPVAEAPYAPATWEQLSKDPASLDGKRVAIPGVFGGEKNWYPIAGVTDKEFRGFEFYDLKPQQARVPLAYMKRGTNTEKTFNALIPFNGQGEPRDKFLFKGTVRFDANAQAYFKGTLAIDSVEPLVETIAATARPTGRDWFVKAGSSGDGSKEKPFKDPWQALEACTPGDVIHVAEGEYFGKLKTGYWTVDVRFIAILGGYDAAFTERDPWKHPTRLGYATGSKAWTSGAYIRGQDDHTGLIFDGFVLDGKDVNQYNAEGNLMADRSPRHALIELASPECTVRNCVLVNGSMGSVTMNGDGGLVENNIILNYHWQSLVFTPGGHNTRPYVIKNNTVLFTWFDRADGQAMNAVGSGLYTRGDITFEVDNNIIAFQDVCGIFTSSDAKKVKLTNNVFSRNLTAHYADGRTLVLEDKSMDKGKDAGFAAYSGNQTIDPQLSLSPKWMELYLARSMRMPGKVTMDDWNKTRDLLGLPVIAEGGKGATNYASAYDWKEAIKIAPKNPAVKAGAKPIPLPIKFLPPPPPGPAPKEYVASEWKAVQGQIATVDKKEVEFTGMIGERNSGWFLADIKEGGEWVAIQIMGPEGKESGLPIQGYFKKDTKLERQLKKAESNAKYTIRGTARKSETFSRGCLILDSIEKSE